MCWARALLRRGARAAKWLGVVVAVLVVTGTVYQMIASRLDARRYPPPGQMVEMGGYRLHLYCTGQGSPTVVLVPGTGGYTLSWSLVQPEVARLTRVCTYDRAGLGWSDPNEQPRSSRYASQQLRELLRRAGVAPPYVLVGHSLGGFHVRMYALQYPEEVAGLVLVDSAISEEWIGENPQETEKKTKESFEWAHKMDLEGRLGAWAARAGLVRLYLGVLNQRPPGLEWLEKLPPRGQAAYFALINRPKTLEANGAESISVVESAVELKGNKIPAQISVVVLVAGLHLGRPYSPDSRWYKDQKELRFGRQFVCRCHAQRPQN